MSIFSRMGDIINSNINSILDKAEDPEKMVRLIIQEMEETLVEVRSTSARAIADKKELTRRHGWLAEETSEWERKAEVAINKGRDDLAKGALAERNRAEEAQFGIERELAVLDETLGKLSEDVATLQDKIKDAKTRQSAIVLRGQAAQTRLGVRRQLSEHNIDDALLRFEQYERKMDDLEGQVESFDLGQRNLADEIQELEQGDDLEAQLAKFKEQVRGQGRPQPGESGSTSNGNQH